MSAAEELSSTAWFARAFGREPSVAADAPGRVNLIGEHTDYNQGLVLPAAIPQHTSVWLAPRGDDVVRVISAEIDDAAPATYVIGDEQAGRGWLDHVQGVTAAARAGGHRTSGFDLAIASDVPIGAGLSSSAALAVALLRGLRALFGWSLDDVELALIAQRSENDLVGAPVGVMDPMAASLAAPGSALFIDTYTLVVQPIPLPPSVELVVISSGLRHQHSSGDYRTRRGECERAAAILGVSSLRELHERPELLARIPELTSPLDRRVRHVVTENDRVRATVAALRAGDVDELGRLFVASHVSQRDDYEVSVPAIDLLVDLAVADRDIVGARLTGGGFGGSIVALARPGRGAAAARRVAAAYGACFFGQPQVLVP
ncbi:MAG TPA: galactokinase [Kofleriaceae bacterium]|nr:galactokinase [Kofleriaceae bacterium]